MNKGATRFCLFPTITLLVIADLSGLFSSTQAVAPSGRHNSAATAVAQGCGLGTEWSQTEAGWNGRWVRRGSSNIFDATWGPHTAVLTINLSGNSVSIVRRGSNNCNYVGTIQPDGVTVKGTYTCDWGGANNSPWSATIRCEDQGSDKLEAFLYGCPSELVAGVYRSETCTICIRNWKLSNSGGGNMRVQFLTNIDNWGSQDSGLQVFSGGFADTGNLRDDQAITRWEGPVWDWSGYACTGRPGAFTREYPWGFFIRAREQAPAGTARLPIRVSQVNGGTVDLRLEVLVKKRKVGDCVWDETEADGWRGTWVRRGMSNQFDATFKRPGERDVTSVLNISTSGNTVSISRTDGPNRFGVTNCSYTGTMSSDKRSASGTYTCTRSDGYVHGPFTWRSNIQCDGGSTGSAQYQLDGAGRHKTAPLKLYWSAQRGDNFTTATAEGEQSALAAGYTFARVEGHVFRTQEPGTVPLKFYWNAGRGDTFTTATAQGERAAQTAGYQFVRIEGYIYPTSQPGTVPLKNYWSPARGDNFTTGTIAGEQSAQAAGYRFAWVEGYLIPAR